MAHTVLVVPVPDLDDIVRDRTAFSDASFVSRDPGFVHAHITILGPWISNPSASDRAAIARIASSVEPVTATLAQVESFPNGLIHLRPEPTEPFAALTAALWAAYPDFPPYGGAFPDPIPHLTLDHTSGGVSVVDVHERVGDRLPTTFVADRLDLQWWANHDCRLLHSWPLGQGGAHP